MFSSLFIHPLFSWLLQIAITGKSFCNCNWIVSYYYAYLELKGFVTSWAKHDLNKPTIDECYPSFPVDLLLIWAFLFLSSSRNIKSKAKPSKSKNVWFFAWRFDTRDPLHTPHKIPGAMHKLVQDLEFPHKEPSLHFQASSTYNFINWSSISLPTLTLFKRERRAVFSPSW